VNPPIDPGKNIRTVAVIGSGNTGRRFALACAAAGFRAILEDLIPGNIRHAQEALAEAALTLSGKLEFATTIEAAVREADLVVDFVPDELESKLELFCLVDRMAPPKTMLLTPSDALSITDLASCTYRGEQCFAVRGEFAEIARGGSVRLLHPAEFSEGSLNAITNFLRAVGGAVQVELDQDAPMLVKNLR
jgi:3-hydroxybutyryl-CoA dehydrogenase